FSDSDLTYADFCYADIGAADFRRARFMRTRMHRAHQQQTRWGDRGGILERDEELYAAETWSAQRQSRI
ncbi:pentapeptide repeat-containing protein, partial [Enterobacter cloacae]